MDTRQDSSSTELSSPLFEITGITLMALAWGVFVLSAKNYMNTDWYLWLLYSRVLSCFVGLFLVGYIIRARKYSKNYSHYYLIYSIAIQSTHGYFEGSKSVEFLNFTGLIFVLSSLSYNGSMSKWLRIFFPIQLALIIGPIFFKEHSSIASVSIFIDNFSLLVSGVIIGIAAAYLNSSRYLWMKKYLQEKEDKFNTARQIYHDLRSPLSLLQGILSSVDASFEEKKNVMEMSLLRIESIAEKLYASSSDEKKEIDIFQYLNLLKFEKTFLFLGKDLKFDFLIPDSLMNKHVPSNFSEILTALSNVIDNGAEASNFCGRVSVKVEHRFQDLIIHIIDSGPGIPSEIVDQIYKKDFTHLKSGGSGLGLYQAKQSVERFKGTIEIVENSYSGVTFEVCLPGLLRENFNKNSKINQLRDEETFSNAVLIDDDKFIRINWLNFFKRRGAQLQAFASLDDFLNKSNAINKNTPIYIDSNLGNGIKGEAESKKIFDLGFYNIYLSTGYSEDSIEKPFWIKKIFSKSPESIFNKV